MEEHNFNEHMKHMHHRMHWKKWVFLLIIILAIAYAFCGQKIWLKFSAKGYQAVFLSNGQVYFGHLTTSGSFYELKDIYYLQVTQPLQQASSDATKTPTSTTTATPQNNIQLVKLGSELHGPQDNMFIEKDKLLFWENMKDDSKVVAAIKQYKSK